jgi:hypothetical protein
MWQIDRPQVPIDWIDLQPVRVLYAFDGPRIFTCRSQSGEFYLAYQCGEDRDIRRFLVVPFSDELERRLVSGDVNLRDALTRTQSWVVDLSNDWCPLRAWQVDLDDIPRTALPKPGVMLWPHLRRKIVNLVRPGRAAGETILSREFPSLTLPAVKA